VRAEFQPTLGNDLFDKIKAVVSLDNPPNNAGQHLGSAYQDGWWGYVSKDLRRLLGRRVKGKYSRLYCGRGNRRQCRTSLTRALVQAANTPASQLYKDDVCSQQGRPNSQTCYDSILFRPLGAVTQPLIPWINRPTFQQVVEVQHHR
jgi:hypothetical protein